MSTLIVARKLVLHALIVIARIKLLMSVKRLSNRKAVSIMAKTERIILEKIAADMAFYSMEYTEKTYDEILKEARKLSNDELINFITEAA